MGRRIEKPVDETRDAEFRLRALKSGLRPLTHPATDPPVGPRPGALELTKLIEDGAMPAEIEEAAGDLGLLEPLLRGARSYERRNA